jgi:DNA-directed RNA polymerase subunit RPC12/RpoP
MSWSKDELRDLIRAVMREELSTRIPQEPHADHVAACPDCFTAALKKMNETSDYACAHCGLPLGDLDFARKLKSCPNCGKNELKKVR